MILWMADMDPPLEPGHPPWEPFNVARVAGLVGAIIGVGVGVVTPLPDFWAGLAGAVIGIVAGYRIGQKGMRRPSD